MNFAHFCEFWCFSLGKQARFTLNCCSGMPLRKVHELAFVWFGLPGPLLIFFGNPHCPPSNWHPQYGLSAQFLAKNRDRKKHPKKICIKNFGGTLAGGSRRGLRRPNSLCRCWFSQQNTVHKEFRGGGLRGSWGVGSKVQFWGPISLCLCAFLGLEVRLELSGKNSGKIPERPRKRSQ